VAAEAQGIRVMIGLIFGPPGSGKGTQAARIQDAFEMQHLSTGEILRHEVALGSDIGKEAARIMAAGDLFPDDLMDQIVKGRLERTSLDASVLLDGFPRTLAQARALDGMLQELARAVDFVVALDVPDAVLIDRLLHRALVEGRADDTRKAIEERMHEYHTRTEPVLDHYRKSGVPVVEVDGRGEVPVVFERIEGALRPKIGAGGI
jgi:adenylate kinase